MSNRGSQASPIDLTADSPPSNRNSKRKAPENLGSSANSPERKKAKQARSVTLKAEDAGQEKSEKRLRRWRSFPPASFNNVYDRAQTQRMFVLQRQRDMTDPDHPVETLQMAGTTGNVYTITIDKIPHCDCPHAMKGNQCKHVVYVLSRVLRAKPELVYQLAFMSAELREIFEQAPPLPSEKADTSDKDGKRKPLDSDCPICCEEFDKQNIKETIVYCKSSCGNNIHKQCFDRWAKANPGAVKCPFCRAPWETEPHTLAQAGSLNEDGYVNVAEQLGISQERDYSSYNPFWVRQRYGHWDDY